MEVLVGAAVLLAVAILAPFLMPAIGTPSGAALTYSLEHHTGGVSLLAEPCVRDRSRAWRCEIPDASGSGSAEYKLHMTSRRCWRARKVASSGYEEGPPYLPKRPAGCVSLRDQVRPLERIGG